jgi:hypothetical protein
MKKIALGAAFALMATVAAFGEDTPPFAASSPAAPGQPDTSNLVSLGDIMGVTELRHIKLWYAGKSKNWPLVDYEIDRITESLRRAALLYSNIPVEDIKAVVQPLADIRDAAATRNTGTFVRGYAKLTAACNSCHSDGKVGFIRIQTPTSSPFSDEDYGK